MREWYSERFHCLVHLSEHAVKRMTEREITKNMIGELIESGEIRYKDEKRMWVYKKFKDREDNLICAAVASEDKLVVKTIMHKWQLIEEMVYEN